MKYALSAAAMLTSLLTAAPAVAGEVFAGALAHGVDTPFTLSTREKGADFQLGYRGEKIEALHAVGAPSPYVFGSVNSKGDTSFVAAGLSWKFGKTLFVRPAIGLALHDGKIPRATASGKRLDLGSRILFEPEIGIGYQFTKRVSAELNWTHVSNATLLSGQNPGLDMIGARMSFRL